MEKSTAGNGAAGTRGCRSVYHTYDGRHRPVLDFRRQDLA